MVSNSRLVDIVKPILKNKSRMFSLSISSSSIDDIESQLWLHVFENAPRFDNLKDSDIRSLASTMLLNKARSLYRKHKTLVKYNNVNNDDVDVSNKLNLENSILGLKIFDKGLHHYNQYDVLEFKELTSIINEWSNKQDKITQRLIKELISPSSDTLNKWQDMMEKHPVYKTYGYIPSCSYHKILGISRPKIVKIMKSLRSHLLEVYSDVGVVFDS